MGRDWESINRTENKTDPRNYCFSQLRSHGLGKIHHVISLGETSAVKRSETKELLSGERRLYIEKLLSHKVK